MKTDHYFISDLHLGSPDAASSRDRERKVIAFLEGIEKTCHSLYILGDLFDYWFEYAQVVPKGHVRLLGHLAKMVDAGTQLHIFTGNHDLWMTGYLADELGATVHYNPLQLTLNGKSFYLAHGDGLGPGDRKYKFMKAVFKSPVSQWLYRRFHPNFGVGFAAKMSQLSRASQSSEDHNYLGEKELQLQHSKTLLNGQHIDFFLYGHRHHKADVTLASPTTSGESRYLVLGDWITLNTYARWDGITLTLNTFTP